MEDSSSKRQKLSENSSVSPVMAKRTKLMYDKVKKTKGETATKKNSFVEKRFQKEDVCEIQTAKTTIVESTNGAKRNSESEFFECNQRKYVTNRSAAVEHSEANFGDKNKDETKWGCPLCTFLNHSALPYCEVCSSAKPGAQREGKTEFTGDDGLLIVSDKCDSIVESSASNSFTMTDLNSDNGEKEADDERMCFQRTGAEMRKLSTSEDEETNTEIENTEKDVVGNTSGATGQSSDNLISTENLCKNDINQPVELSSEEFQFPIEEWTDTGDEKGGHCADVRMNESGMVEGNDNKQLYGDKILRCTPEKNEGKQVIVFVYISIYRQSLKFTFSRS